MNLFSKKYKNIKAYPDKWSITQGVSKGKPIFVRFREGLMSAIGHPDYPFQIGVAVPLLNPTEDGLTKDSEVPELEEIEGALQKKITKDDMGIFVLAITTNGMREFVFYVKEWKPELFEGEVKSINPGSHEIQFMMQHDAKWKTFKEFTK